MAAIRLGLDVLIHWGLVTQIYARELGQYCFLVMAWSFRANFITNISDPWEPNGVKPNIQKFRSIKYIWKVSSANSQPFHSCVHVLILR